MMGTGRELARTVSCSVWTDEIMKLDGYRGFQIFDNDGHKITPEKAKGESFCHLRVFFKEIDPQLAKIIAVLLRNVASTRSEQMSSSVNIDYCLTEVIIL